ncbi:MAG: Ribosome-binding protein aMBF1 translation factor containing Zn-ribbon and HTH domain [Candidatus Methanohalarchaeum thermophilum]|uniref:Ribosome-binding protein aMBF1 translation factor containing Zn-ribbon and HTH domain n=1 Tax=Methanohalarchaeum thermophilum TaxID=1903181 RepID=A0A1Q6DTN7_METT1|nr:MAG: Ribosome-binding protein aMBF1 translation factor containing Zn-ribbon and HTH domain [Candidatus Methanohalarchaeum thermophilum]
MHCEICGKKIDNAVRVEIDGSEMNVCQQCKSLGTRVKSEKEKKAEQKKKQRTTVAKKKTSKSKSRESIYDEMEELSGDYSQKIRAAREESDLTQEKLAKEINVKKSLIGKFERGEKLPEEEVVKKLEDYFDIDLKD